MPNTNFQTIHQMGAAINDFVKQATGRDNVQNIDMDYVTVAQNHYYAEVDVSGSIVSFRAGAAGIPLEKCLLQINPVQDLHGYDHPWPAGGGKNLLPMKLETMKSANTTGIWNENAYSLNGITFTVQVDSGNNVIGIVANGVANAMSYFNITMNTYSTLVSQGFIDEQSYILTGCPVGGGSATNYCLMLNAGNTSNKIDIGAGASVIANNTDTYFFQIRVFDEYIAENLVFKPMFRISTETDNTFIPYSNICPISGWNEAKVFVSPTTDAADGTTYTITFQPEPGTVYGGTLDAVTGELIVNNALISGYAGEALPGAWISDRDVYSEGATPSTGAQVVYELANPITYSLTPIEISTLLGVNNIWADTGDIEVKFTDIRGLY